MSERHSREWKVAPPRAKHPNTLGAISEANLEQAILAAAQLYGWRCHHVRDSRHVLMGDVGFPDWVFARRGTVLIVELKRQDGKLSPEQRAWLDDLAWPGEQDQWVQESLVDAYVIRPSDLDRFLELLK